jgi:hypothetical protein
MSLSREQRRKAGIDRAIAGAKAKLIAAIAPYSRAAAAAFETPQFKALLDEYADAALAIAAAADDFAKSQSADAAQVLSDAALRYRDSLLAMSPAGDEIKRKVLSGELH